MSSKNPRKVITPNQLDNEFRSRFIEAMEKDIHSSKHGTEINHYVFEFGKRLLRLQVRSTRDLSLEQTIRGILNLAVAQDNGKYGQITENNVGKEAREAYSALCTEWFKDLDRDRYNKELRIDEEKGFPILRDILQHTGKGPLVIMPNCAEHTLAVYFEYAKKLDHSIVIPEIPKDHPRLKGGSGDKLFKLQIITQEVKKGFLANAEEKSEAELLKELKQNIATAKNAYVDYSNSIWFSLFHRHGNTGRVRAEEFAKKFEQIDNFNDAKEMLVKYLHDPKNGNTNPHSFRTMLLAQVLGTEDNAYQAVSKSFDNSLKGFTKDLNTLNPQEGQGYSDGVYGYTA